jgi:uncharacterized membrane protein YidH (DUF202 family)
MENLDPSTSTDLPQVLLFMVVVTVFVFRAGARNYREGRRRVQRTIPFRDRALLWARSVGLMLAGGVAAIWPTGRLVGAW